MPSQQIGKITVLGAGTMGSAIAQFFAVQGRSVSLYSRTEATLQKALCTVRENLAMMAELGQLDPGDVDSVVGRIAVFTDFEQSLEQADWVIETVSENKEAKKQVIEAADRIAPKHAYLTSDTSAINIFEFLETSRPERVMITHFFNPASLMPLVEIVPGPETARETIDSLRNFLEAHGKKPIVLKECIPGFIANRLTLALAREAYYLAGEGYASIEDIDRVIVTTFGPRYVFEGIFDLYDHIGLDVGYAVAKDLLPQLCSSVEVPRLLREKVEAGLLGVKTKKGLKDYSGEEIAALCAERNRKIAKALKAAETL